MYTKVHSVLIATFTKVEGMEVGVSMGMTNQNGSLKLSVMECGCYMKELDITLNGGASWFYQVYVVHKFVLQALCC
jgi:hypothetical protein